MRGLRGLGYKRLGGVRVWGDPNIAASRNRIRISGNGI